MMSIATLRGMVVVGIAVVGAACGPKETPGVDPNTDTSASTIVWSDGKSAVQIKCGSPGGCLTRAVAMCGDNYITLKKENMPTSGDMVYVRGPASVVVRCPSS